MALAGQRAFEQLEVLGGSQLVLVQVLEVLEQSQLVLEEPLLEACLFEEVLVAALSAFCFLFGKVYDAVFFPPHCCLNKDIFLQLQQLYHLKNIYIFHLSSNL